MLKIYGTFIINFNYKPSYHGGEPNDLVWNQSVYAYSIIYTYFLFIKVPRDFKGILIEIEEGAT